MSSSTPQTADADIEGAPSAVDLQSLRLEVATTSDGRITGAASDFLPPPLRPLFLSDEAAERRRQALQAGHVAYSTECAGHRWDISLTLLPSSNGEPRRLSCSIERADAGPGSSIEEEPASGDDLVDVLPDVVVITDLEGSLIYANRSAVELLGVNSRDDLVGRPIWSFVHPEELATARREGWLLEGGKRVEYIRHHVVRPNGQTVPVEIVTGRTTFRGEPAFLISAHDLTGLRTVEQELEETQQLFYRVFKTGPLAIAVSRLANRTLVDVNDAFCRLAGVRREAVIDRTAEDIGLQFDREQLARMRRMVETEGASGEIELRMIDPGGRSRTLLVSSSRIDVRGEPCMLSMASDITERKQAALALRESEERFRAMADTAPVLIWISDRDGQTTYFNQRWLEFTGRSPADELGEGWSEGVHPDDRQRFLHANSRGFELREDYSLEYRLRRHDGVYRWMLDRAVPRFLPDGTFVGYIGSCVDITERKRAEQKLLQSKQQAEDLTILKSAFLTNMTHEIRTPLTVILGFTSILRQGTRREYHRFVNLIERSGRRLLLMLDSVLDLAQLEAGTLTVEINRHNIADIVHSVIATLVPIAEDKDLYLKYDEPEDIPYANVDAAVVARVLNNLLDNAIKFTEKGGVRVELEQDEKHSIIRIIDTGIGIGSEFIPHIYDAFSQESTGIERTHQGSGLGMTVSRQLLELLDGDVSIQSEKGKGSTVTVRLPN